MEQGRPIRRQGRSLPASGPARRHPAGVEGAGEPEADPAGGSEGQGHRPRAQGHQAGQAGDRARPPARLRRECEHSSLCGLAPAQEDAQGPRRRARSDRPTDRGGRRSADHRRASARRRAVAVREGREGPVQHLRLRQVRRRSPEGARARQGAGPGTCAGQGRHLGAQRRRAHGRQHACRREPEARRWSADRPGLPRRPRWAGWCCSTP